MSRRDSIEHGLALLFVTTLLLARQAAMVLDPANAFYLHWGFADALVLSSMIVVPSLALWLLRMSLARLQFTRIERLFDHLLTLCVAIGAISVQRLFFVSGGAATLMLMAALAVVAFSLGTASNRLPNLTRKLCVIFSPFAAIVCCQLLTAESWASTRNLERLAPQRIHAAAQPLRDRGTRLVARSTDLRAAPVFFLVMDCWDFETSTFEGEFRDYFVNLRRLTNQAFVFKQGRSPDTHTIASLPLITHQAATSGEGRRIGEVIMPANAASIFADAHGRGYRTALIGFYLPYERMFGDELDAWASYPYDSTGTGLIGKLTSLSLRNLQYIPGPITQGLHLRITPSRFSRHWYNITCDMQRDIAETIGRMPDNTLVFVHAPVPHAPYVFNEDGSYFGHIDPAGADLRGSTSDAGYLRQLKYLDRWIGWFLDVLTTAGMYDDALVILTSDHGWNSKNLRHVPLIVKLPGQTKAATIDSPFGNYQLRPLLNAVMEGKDGEPALRSTVRASVAH
jgi:hypothetical protein